MNIKLFEDMRNITDKEPETLIESCVLKEFFVHPDATIQQFNLTADTNWSNPSILPCRFDLTWQRYFKRIGSWGKVKILHVDPEKRKRDYITQDAFLKRMGNADLLKVYGKWEVQQSNIRKYELWNKYIGMNGKEYKEIIQIQVDLIPELKKGLSFWQKVF